MKIVLSLGERVLRSWARSRPFRPGHHIGKQKLHVFSVPAECAHRVGCISSFQHPVARRQQNLASSLAHETFIFDQENSPAASRYLLFSKRHTSSPSRFRVPAGVTHASTSDQRGNPAPSVPSLADPAPRRYPQPTGT